MVIVCWTSRHQSKDKQICTGKSTWGGLFSKCLEILGFGIFGSE